MIWRGGILRHQLISPLLWKLTENAPLYRILNILYQIDIGLCLLAILCRITETLFRIIPETFLPLHCHGIGPKCPGLHI